MEIHTHKRLNILFKTPFRELVKIKLGKLRKEIMELPDSTFQNKSGKELGELEEHYSEKNRLGNLPEIFWEEKQGKITKVKLTAKDLPSNFDRGFTGTVERKKIDIFVPFGEGRDDILVYCGDKIDYSKNSLQHGYFTTRQFNSAGVPYVINRSRLQFTYIDYWNDAEKINELFAKDKREFEEHFTFLKNTIKNFESNVPSIVKGFIGNKKDKLRQDEEYLSRLAFPISTSPDIPESFIPKKIDKVKKIHPKSTSKVKESNEWYISEEDYNGILRLLYDCGKMWEKYPRLYEGRDEESLRDQLLFVLVPNISAVVAGEAYNKKGKTDISIKHENTNLFIGECKIWKGPKGLKETINQILNYLTWRDSKSAIMNFVPNNDIGRTIEDAEQTIMQHPNFVRKVEKKESGWINYKFKLNQESDTYLTMAFLFIHTPNL